MESLIVPSSIQRIRSFLVEMCGMKVKPWAGSEETLSALHATLVARKGCDIFWTSLRVLLETLARDLKERQEAPTGELVDNEVLDGERYATLIDEIRAALAYQAAGTPTSTFRRLASTLSSPALALLLLLGGAASVGCDREPLHSPAKMQDAATLNLADARTAQPDSAVTITLPAQPDATNTVILIPQPDTSSPRDAVTSGPDGAAVTIQDIMDSCNVPSQVQTTVLACLTTLRSSWSTGLASVLAGQNCATVSNQLNCFPSSYACLTGPPTSEFDPQSTPICKPVPIYYGVRFV
jgi:hypothetical protein